MQDDLWQVAYTTPNFLYPLMGNAAKSGIEYMIYFYFRVEIVFLIFSLQKMSTCQCTFKHSQKKKKREHAWAKQEQNYRELQTVFFLHSMTYIETFIVLNCITL